MDVLEVTGRIRIPHSEFAFSFARSSGPGGQNVNKVNSKAVFRWNPTTSPSLPEAVRERFLARFASRLTVAGELVLDSEQSRDQRKNIDDCLLKVATMLREVAVPPKPRRPTKPSKASQRRRVEDKKVNAARKQSRRQPRNDD